MYGSPHRRWVPRIAVHPAAPASRDGIIEPVRLPPPIVETPARMAWYVVSGLVLLVLALIAEFGRRPKPIVPASYVPGFLFLTVGAAFAMAILDRYRPRIGGLLYLGPMLIIGWFAMVGQNSMLPLLLYAGLFQLLRALLRAIPFGE